jgi:DNA-binding NarL/FixJ family response regulator
MNVMNKEPMKLSEVDQKLVRLIAVGLTNEEIATQLLIPKHELLNHIARLLAKLGVRDRVEIVLYACSNPAMYQLLSSEIIRKTMKKPQAETPQVKQKAS